MSNNTTQMTSGFYVAMWNAPGCLPDTDGPLPIFGSYAAAADYLADHLDVTACGIEEGVGIGDDFERMARNVRETIGNGLENGAGGWSADGPDGYVYSIEECEPRAVFVAEGGQDGQTTLYARVASDTPSAEEIREDVQSIAGSGVEVADETLAYAIVDVDRLDEARAELREGGYGLDLSLFPTMREALGIVSEFDLHRLSDYGALDVGFYETLADDERAKRVLALAAEGGASVSYGHLDPAKGADVADVATVGALVGSDYNGGALVRSNVAEFRKLLDEEDARLRLDTWGDHGTHGVLVFLDIRTTDGAASTIVEAMRGLLDYPCLNEEAMSGLEHEEAEEAWKDCGHGDYCRALQNQHGITDVEDDGGERGLRELFDARAEHCNSNGGPGIIHEETGPFFLCDDVAKDTPACLVAFLGMVDLSGLDGLDIGLKDPDDARRLLRILRVGQALRLYVAPAIVRGMLAETEAYKMQRDSHASDGAVGEEAQRVRREYAEDEARRWLMSADFDEGDTSAGIDAESWEVWTQRIVRVTLRRYVPGLETREVVVVIDPKQRYLYGPDMDKAVARLFRS